jgi:hypothetical protein
MPIYRRVQLLPALPLLLRVLPRCPPPAPLHTARIRQALHTGVCVVMVDGGWRMVDGGWWMVDGGWRIVDGGWWMVDGG